jgi:oligoribonuclease (3'-5' exoribonuclease)
MLHDVRTKVQDAIEKVSAGIRANEFTTLALFNNYIDTEMLLACGNTICMLRYMVALLISDNVTVHSFEKCKWEFETE